MKRFRTDGDGLRCETCGEHSGRLPNDIARARWKAGHACERHEPEGAA